MDALDARLILALDDDADATVLGLARTLGVARNTVTVRLKRLEESGALREVSRRVNTAALGYTLVAFVSVAISQVDNTLVTESLEQIPEVIEMHSITGDADLLVKVAARNTEDLLRVTGAMLALEGVVRTNTVISLSEAMPLRMRGLLEGALTPPRE